MNVVTGLFLQSAIEQASQDHEHVIQQQLAQTQRYVQNLKKLFRQLDSSGDGTIRLDELEEHLERDRMKAFLKTIDIDIGDAWTFFKLLDSNYDGSIDMHEFVEGCLRLSGNAKSIHVAQMMYENQWIMDKLNEMGSLMQTVSRTAVHSVSRSRSRLHDTPNIFKDDV